MGHTGFDFSGWATKNDLLCEDGRIIRKGAFSSQNGMKVPLAWNHQHNDPTKVLGHAFLEDRPEGVYAYAYFNDTPAGKHAKEAVKHGDVTSMSIWASNVQENRKNVVHGVIREVSLVLAGSNPGAFIESIVSHGFPMEEGDDEAMIYTGDNIFVVSEDLQIQHSAEDTKDSEDKKSTDNGDQNVGDVLDTLSEVQKKAVAIMVGQLVTDLKGEEKEEEDVRHNAFEGDAAETANMTIISHAIREQVLETAKITRSLKAAVKEVLADGEFMHSIDTTGMITAQGNSDYGINDMSMLFPEYKTEKMPPEFISRNMDWVSDVLTSVSISPFPRIKTMFADITEDEARAKGYMTGDLKKPEVFSLLKRTTDPQTIYKLQKFDRDDILDITEFEVIPWVKGEMRLMMNEEKARAILIGDGRLADDEHKIRETNIRPVVADVSLFNTTVLVEEKSGDTEATFAKRTIDAVIRSRKKYKGSGSPKFYTTEDVLTEMLMIEDSNGHKLYKTEAELATALRVSKIVTVEPMEGHKIKYGNSNMPLIGVIVNLKDYKVGRNPKVNENNFFDDFDLDYNKLEYLLEDRFSGALIKPFSAITLLKKELPASGGTSGSSSGETSGSSKSVSF